MPWFKKGPGWINNQGWLGGAVGNVLWTPAQFGTDMVRRYDTSDGASSLTLSGSNVSAWADKSSQAVSVTQATSGFQPTYNATARNGKPGVNFSGVLLNGATTGLPVGSSACTIFVVGYSSSSDQQLAVSYGQGSAQKARGLGVNGGNDYYEGYNNDINGSIPWAGADQILSCEIAGGTNPAINIYSPSATDTSSLQTQNTSTSFVTLGARAGGGDPFFQGTLQAVIIVNRVLTTVERQKLQGWAAWTFNLTSLLPAGHPYKSVAPNV